MKKLFLSEQPRHACNVLNRIKKIEIRKTKPTCNLPNEVLMYCTKQQDIIKLNRYAKDEFVLERNFNEEDFEIMNSGYTAKGCVVARFNLKKVEKIEWHDSEGMFDDPGYRTETMDEETILRLSCLSREELYDYLQNKGEGYAWYIEDLVVFDKPISLKAFGLERGPQSYGYIELKSSEEVENENS